ncbi:hypothetical protein HDU99_010238, partial [Rhizoclosmatium hyalinum]
MHVLCKIYDLIGKIKRFLVTPPSSLAKLLQNDSRLHFRTKLQSIHSYAPKELFLVTESVLNLKTTDVDQFQIQLGQNPVSVMAFNFQYLSCVSILNRPILFMTTLASCAP